MSLLGRSFEEQVSDALARLKEQVPGVRYLSAKVDGKVVTLEGLVEAKEVKFEVMREFNALVQTENTVNTIAVMPGGPYADTVPLPPKAMPGQVEATPAPATDRLHVIAPGETLGGIALAYYGKASLYTKIFEANRDQLKDPNVIRAGQKIRIPP